MSLKLINHLNWNSTPAKCHKNWYFIVHLGFQFNSRSLALIALALLLSGSHKFGQIFICNSFFNHSSNCNCLIIWFYELLSLFLIFRQFPILPCILKKKMQKLTLVYIQKRARLESSGRRPISSFGKTKRKAFFVRQDYYYYFFYS